ncbi:MAG: hypothetical protein WAV11_00130 [Minisyncoccia bacterium]
MNNDTQKGFDWKKYIFALVITSLIFGTAIYIGNYFNNRKVEQVSSIEKNIALDIMASETQFALLSELSCKDIASSSALSLELNNLNDRLQYIESTLGTDNEEFARLKKQYSVLEIKDYLLLKKLNAQCKTKPITVLYFYNNDCYDCTKEGYVLTELRQTYPNVRVYSFDMDLDLPVIKTLAKINKVGDKMPVIIINGQNYEGFKDLAELEKIVPELKESNATTTATNIKK